MAFTEYRFVMRSVFRRLEEEVEPFAAALPEPLTVDASIAARASPEGPGVGGDMVRVDMSIERGGKERVPRKVAGEDKD